MPAAKKQPRATGTSGAAAEQRRAKAAKKAYRQDKPPYDRSIADIVRRETNAVTKRRVQRSLVTSAASGQLDVSKLRRVLQRPSVLGGAPGEIQGVIQNYRQQYRAALRRQKNK